MAKILLVEDNEMSRYMLSRRLERRGYEVAIAVNVLAAVQNKLPGLILIDMGLPELDGWEVTYRLKANEATPGYSGNCSDRICPVWGPRKGSCSRL